MLRMVMLLGTAGLVACGDKESDTGGGSDTDPGADPVECTNSISETFPSDAESEAFYKTSVEFKLVTAETDATISVTDSAGADVAGTTEVDGTTVRFTPSTGFASGETYTATLDYSCADATISFSTDPAVGTPIADPSTLVGNVYTLPLTEGRFVEPPGVGDLLGGLLTVNVLIEVAEASATEIRMMGAISMDGNPNAQDLCTETIDFPTAADFSGNPFFAIGPEDTTLNVSGVSVTVDDLSITGAFSNDGTSMEGASLAGVIDTRPLEPLVGADACELLAGFGIPCIPCPSGDGDFCLALEVQDMTAVQVNGLDLVPRSQAEIDADASCVPPA